MARRRKPIEPPKGEDLIAPVTGINHGPKNADPLNFARLPVESSNIASVGYEGDILTLEFKSGGIWAYQPITPNEHRELIEAESIGKYFHANIKYNKSITATKLG